MRFKILLLLVFINFSCESKIEFLDYNSIDNVWHRDSIQSFVFELTSTNKHNTYINLRINEEYQFSNIFLINFAILTIDPLWKLATREI